MAATEISIYLQAMLLPDADTFSMASSVELRVPFVDRLVFAAAFEIARGRSKAPGKAAIGATLERPLPSASRDTAEARFQPADGALAYRTASGTGRSVQGTGRSSVVSGGQDRRGQSGADI